MGDCGCERVKIYLRMVAYIQGINRTLVMWNAYWYIYLSPLDIQILQRKSSALYQSDAEALLVMLQEHISCWKKMMGTTRAKGQSLKSCTTIRHLHLVWLHCFWHDTTKMKHLLKLTANLQCDPLYDYTLPWVCGLVQWVSMLSICFAHNCSEIPSFTTVWLAVTY